MNKNNNILLLGAGFSRNWGGWLADEVLEYLLGSKEINADIYLREKLYQYKQMGFEKALGEIQLECLSDPSEKNKKRQKEFSDAVSQMFKDMRKPYANNQMQFEWTADIDYQVRPFLIKFNTIFTLNQDFLLEQLLSPEIQRKLVKPYLSELQKPLNDDINTLPIYSSNIDNEIKINSSMLPYYKLHGSYDWIDNHGGTDALMVMGGGKAETIKLHPVLRKYQQQFCDSLSKPSTRLMIIGYSFRDEHINKQLTNAATAIENNLKIYIIDPKGIDVISDENIKQSLHPTLIGASRRPLKEIFGSDKIEHAKIMKFFDTLY